MNLQKIIEAFEELGVTGERATRRIIDTVMNKDKLQELAEAFREAGLYKEEIITLGKYDMICRREAERLARNALQTEKGILITPQNITDHKIDFLEFVDAVHKKHFCMQPGCTTCGNMEYRKACTRIGREGLIQLMLNTEPAAMVHQYRDMVHIRTIDRLFPGTYSEYLERRERKELSEGECK